MSYEAVEASARTILTGVSGFSTDTVIIGDYGQLSRGYDRAMVLSYSDFSVEDIAGGGDKLITWAIELHLYEKYTNDVDVHNAARDDRWAILSRLMQYHRLNAAAGVYRADIVSGMTPSRGGAPGALDNIVIGYVHYYHETLRLEIVEHVDVAYAE